MNATQQALRDQWRREAPAWDFHAWLRATNKQTGAKTMYKIIRHYKSGDRLLIKTVSTLEEAQAHCRDPETNWNTCTGYEALKQTERYGPWFDSYEELK